MRLRPSDLLPLAVAIVVPLAGLALALQQATQGNREVSLRIASAAFLGVVLWVAVLQAT